MITVLLLGKKDDLFTNYFLRRLSSYIYVSLNDVRIKKINAGDLMVYDSDESFFDIEIKYDVIVFKNSTFDRFDLKQYLNEKSIVCIPGENKELRDYLKELGIGYITFGLYHEDTVSVSSISEERMSVCIQKPFQDFSGKTVEAGEFIVSGVFNSQCLYASMTGAVLNHIFGKELNKTYHTFSFRLND